MDIHEKLLTRFSLDDIVRPLFDHLLLVLWLSLFFANSQRWVVLNAVPLSAPCSSRELLLWC